MFKRAQAARLLAVDRESSGTRLLLLKRDEAGIGSAEGSGLHVTDPSVASHHATIRYKRGRYYVVDLKSDEGTFLNGQRIRRKHELKHGDILRFGGAAPYRFIDPDALKRRRRRRNLRVTAVVATLVAIGWVDHREKLGLLNATYTQLASWMNPNATAKHAEPPVAAVPNATARPAAPIAAAIAAPARPAAPIAAAAPPRHAQRSAPSTSIPGLAAYAANVEPPSPPPIPKSAPPSSSTTKVSAASSMTWVERINFFRAGAGLAPIRDDSQLSAAAAAHAHYLLLNFGDDIRAAKPMGPDAYDEQPGKAGYSIEGAKVSRNLQLSWGCSSYDPGLQMDRWIEGPFHRLAMLDPYLSEAGYGEASADGCWVATLRLPPPAEEVKAYPHAIEFPPDGASTALDWVGPEAPDPLASCDGYSRPVGLPITLQIGRLVPTKLSAHSLTEDGKPIDHCAFDAPAYQNGNATAQEYGRWNLRNEGAVVIVPREPLRPGSHYAVSITANDQTYAWSFNVADTQATTFADTAKFPMPPASPAAEVSKSAAASTPSRRARAAHRASPAAMPSEVALESPGSSPITSDAHGTVSTSSNWLTVLNQYRTRLNIPPVDEDPALSKGCVAHAKYLMRNFGRSFKDIGIQMHQEDQSRPGYSTEGLKAAQSSDVVYQPRNAMTEDQLMGQAIEWWISGPFHRPELLSPALMRAGFGQYCEGAGCVSAVNVVSDSALALPGGNALAQPIRIPPDGATVKAPRFGGEWPSPVSSCPGYPPSAPAITLQLGLHVPAKMTDGSLTQTTGPQAGTKVETCSYDSDGYTNPDRGAQSRGRQVLSSFGEVVMMVRDPLTAGETYRVGMIVNGKTYSWSFTAAP